MAAENVPARQRFAGRTAVVTGGGSGIGARTVRRLAEEGATVVAADLNLDAAEAVVAELPGCLAVRVDVADPEAVKEFAATVHDRVGAVDVLVNNAHSCTDIDLLTASHAQLSRDLNVTLMGPMLITQALLGPMIDNGGGVVVNVASVNGLGWFGNAAYSAAKAGLVNFSQGLAVEYGDCGVRCVAVAPGTIDSPAWDARKRQQPGVMETIGAKYPLGRVGTVDDISNALLWVASDEASWITGVCLPVEGGILGAHYEFTRSLPE